MEGQWCLEWVPRGLCGGSRIRALLLSLAVLSRVSYKLSFVLLSAADVVM